MEWQVFGVIVALCGFAGAIITPGVKLNSSITRLTVTMERLVQDVRELREKSREEHGRLWRKHEEQEHTLTVHETRIATLENRRVS